MSDSWDETNFRYFGFSAQETPQPAPAQPAPAQPAPVPASEETSLTRYDIWKALMKKYNLEKFI